MIILHTFLTSNFVNPTSYCLLYALGITVLHTVLLPLHNFINVIIFGFTCAYNSIQFDFFLNFIHKFTKLNSFHFFIFLICISSLNLCHCLCLASSLSTRHCRVPLTSFAYYQSGIENFRSYMIEQLSVESGVNLIYNN